MTEPTQPRQPSVDWVRDVLGRNILVAAQDVRTAASYQYAGSLVSSDGDFVHTFRVARTTWTITHNRTYNGDRVDGFEVTVTRESEASVEQHLQFVSWFLEQAGYEEISVNNDAAHGFMSVPKPFIAIAYT